MKVAICLSGLVGSMSGPNFKYSGGVIHPSMGKYFLDNVLCDHYDVDVFAHSWSTEMKDEILSTWNPKKHLIEKQIEFYPDIKKYGESFDLDQLAKDRRYGPSVKYHSKYDYSQTPHSSPEEGEKYFWKHVEKLVWRAHSRWYSNSKCLELKKEYQKETGTEYDFVLLTRFDVFYNTRFNLEELDKNCFYGGARYSDGGKQRHDYDFALEDFWYLAGSDVMDKFGSKVYNNIYDYCWDSPYSAREVANELVGEENVKLLLKARGGKDFNLIRNVYANIAAQQGGNPNTVWKI